MKSIVSTLLVLLLSCALFAQQFTKVTTGPIVEDLAPSNSGNWIDYDNDGDVDLFVANSGSQPNSLYRNNGNGTFTKITTGVLVTDVGSSPYGSSWGDYDNDGDLDVFIANSYQSQNSFLYTNNGDGTFTKGSMGSSARGATWGDYDNDGDVDLFVTYYPNNSLIRNDGNGSFTGIPNAGIAEAETQSYGCSWADYDNDGDLDLFIANFAATFGQKNYLYSNNGDGTFTKVTDGPIVNDGGAYCGSWGDYDNDGDLDLFVAANGQTNFLYRNNGNGIFTKITSGIVVSEGGASTGGNWVDYDNDGDLDLYVTNTNGVPFSDNFLYRNDGNGNFSKITTEVIARDGGQSTSSAWGDFDNDGDLDLFVANTGLQGENINAFYVDNGNNNHWINIKCIGTFSNKATIGAKVRVKANIRGNNVWQMREISGGNDGGVGGQNSLNVEFGFGDATVIDSIKVEWPSRFVQVLTNVLTNQFLTIIESGNPPMAPQNLQAKVGIEEVTLTWMANTEPDFLRCRIYGGTTPNPSVPIDSIEGKSNTTKTIKKLTGGTTYYFRLTAVNTGLQASGFSNEVSATPTAADLPPAAPQNLQARAGDRQITLSWKANTETDFLRYRIFGGVTPIPTTVIDSVNGSPNTSKIMSGLTNGTTYYFRITAVDLAGNQSGFSNEVSATPTAADIPPAAPQGLTAIAGDRQITLKWRQNTEADFLRYRIYRGTSPNPITKVDSTNGIADTTKTFTGLTNGTIYYFRITAVDQNLNESGYSNEVSATPATANVPPASPQNLAAIAGDRQITLTWTANSEADFLRYRIYGGTSHNPVAIVDSVEGIANTSKTLTGLNNGTTYFYRLTAVDQALNSSGFSNEVSATPSATDLPPAVPQNLAATAGVVQVTLTWNANTETDFLRYRIYGGTNPNPTAIIDSVEGANNTAKIISNLTIGTTYYFRLTAVDQALHASGYSNSVTAKPLADNAAPTLANAVYSEPANLNSEVAVVIAATDVSGIKNVWLYYRVAGAATFFNRVMARQNNDTYTQSIPAAAITNKGAEFYVAAEDAYGNVAQTGLHPVRVYCPSGIANPNVQPSGAAASFYRLFSMPLALDDKSPAMFLTTNSSLGAYDKTKYRWYGLVRTTQLLREYPNFGNIQMTSDMGFALLVNIRNVKLKTSSGTTVATTAPHNISLPAGWSLIGNPFNFNIPFDSLRVSNGTFELWSFEGDWQINTRGLEPWKGYAIWLSEAATFSIRPGVAGLKSATSFYSVENNAAENWLVQIIADNGRSAQTGGASRFNFAGQYAGATDDDDELDLHQPVRLADGVEVVFGKKNSVSLKADIRRPSSRGHTWEFTCRLNPEDEVLSLTFDGVATVPQAFDIFLIEPETATAYNLRANPRLQFATRNLTEKRFQLVAGTKAYLHEQALPAELHPSGFELLQNFPNPFNPATQIIYSLPEASHVEVSVYNVRGEAVATLVNERQESGSHTVVWNAEKVGSGVYFIKMQAGRVERMRKCVFVK